MKHLLSIGLLLFTSIAFGQKKVVLNTFHKDSVTFYIGFQKLHETFNYLQAAQKFSTDNAGSMLRQVDIHRLVVPLKDFELRKSSETDDLIYQPLLGMVKNKKTTSDALVMTPEHKWIMYTHNLPYMTDLSISAHIISK